MFHLKREGDLNVRFKKMGGAYTLSYTILTSANKSKTTLEKDLAGDKTTSEKAR